MRALQFASDLIMLGVTCAYAIFVLDWLYPNLRQSLVALWQAIRERIRWQQDWDRLWEMGE